MLRILESLCWLLPASPLKNALLRMAGREVSRSASIGPTLVWRVGRIDIGDNVRIGLLNTMRGLSHAVFEEGAIVESWNWISAHPGYQTVDSGAGTLFLGAGAKIGSRNYIDCSGTVVLREYSQLGGNRCLVQSHEPDYGTASQHVGRITIGHHSQVASSAVLLKGAYLPDRSLLAANSTMLARPNVDAKQGLYAGSPAVWKRPTTGAFFEAQGGYAMETYVVDEPMGVLASDVELADRPL